MFVRSWRYRKFVKSAFYWLTAVLHGQRVIPRISDRIVDCVRPVTFRHHVDNVFQIAAIIHFFVKISTLGGAKMDLLPVHGPNAARHVPFATVSRIHADAVVFTGEYSTFYVSHDMTIVGLRTVKNTNNSRNFFFFFYGNTLS